MQNRAMNDGPEPDLPAEYLIELGRIISRWGFLESMIDLCLIKLAGKDVFETRSSIIFSHMAFPMKLDVMGALITELLPEYPRLDGFKEVLQSLKRAQELRNRFLHCKWGRDEENRIVIMQLSARGKLKFSTSPISVQEVREAADVITNAAKELYLLVMASAASAAAMTNKPPQSGQ